MKQLRDELTTCLEDIIRKQADSLINMTFNSEDPLSNAAMSMAQKYHSRKKKSGKRRTSKSSKKTSTQSKTPLIDELKELAPEFAIASPPITKTQQKTKPSPPKSTSPPVTKIQQKTRPNPPKLTSSPTTKTHQKPRPNPPKYTHQRELATQQEPTSYSSTTTGTFCQANVTTGHSMTAKSCNKQPTVKNFFKAKKLMERPVFKY
jgi:hypothetical protein